MERLVSRQHALKEGLNYYFTGKPCVNDHISRRRLPGNECIQCSRDKWRRWRDSHRDAARANKRRQAAKHAETIAAKNRAKYAAETPEQRAHRTEVNKRWAIENADRKKRIDAAWRAANPDRVAATVRRQAQKPTIKIRSYLRARLNMAVRKKQKAGSAIRDLGCSIPEFMAYFETLFAPGMTWDNWGAAWEIDHMKPLSSFDLADRQQFLVACHFTNLQPLLIPDHRAKTRLERSRMRVSGQTT